MCPLAVKILILFIEEDQRRKEADAMKTQLETQKKQQGNAITDMFDRLKMENDHRYF